MGLDAKLLIFWMLSFQPGFSHSSLTFIKRFHSSSSLSAKRVVPSAYLRLLIFLLAILIPVCALSSPVFLMMYSAYKINKQGDNIQLWSTPFPNLESVYWSMSGAICCFLTCIQVSQEAGKLVWYFHLLKNFPVCCDPQSQRHWCHQWSRSRCCSGICLLFLWSKGCWQFDLWFLCLF